MQAQTAHAQRFSWTGKQINKPKLYSILSCSKHGRIFFNTRRGRNIFTLSLRLYPLTTDRKASHPFLQAYTHRYVNLSDRFCHLNFLVLFSVVKNTRKVLSWNLIQIYFENLQFLVLFVAKNHLGDYVSLKFIIYFVAMGQEWKVFVITYHR